jgi:hypothetical protein
MQTVIVAASIAAMAARIIVSRQVIVIATTRRRTGGSLRDASSGTRQALRKALDGPMGSGVLGALGGDVGGLLAAPARLSSPRVRTPI